MASAENTKNNNKTSCSSNTRNEDEHNEDTRHMLKSLASFRRISVWLPYALNQSGSLLYYRLLATSDLSLAVPICNALALAFGSITASCLGESVDRPMRVMFGCVLISAGVIVCMMS